MTVVGEVGDQNGIAMNVAFQSLASIQSLEEESIPIGMGWGHFGMKILIKEPYFS